MVDWAQSRMFRFSMETAPPEWPEGVKGISMNGLNLLGIHERSGRLYWDGKQLMTRNKIRFGGTELWLLFFAAVGTFGGFVLEVGRIMRWWT